MRIRAHYVIPFTMLVVNDGSGAGVQLRVDGVVTRFGGVLSRLAAETLGPEAHLAIVTVEWMPDDAPWADAFEAIPGVVLIPPPWEAETPAPPELREVFASVLPAALKARPDVSAAELHRALPRLWRQRLVPW
jgi:hypothetical protein